MQSAQHYLSFENAYSLGWQPESQRVKRTVGDARKRLKIEGCTASFFGFLGQAKNNMELEADYGDAQSFEACPQPFW